MISAKRKGECVIGQVRGGVLQAQSVGDLLGLHIGLGRLVVCQGVRRYIVVRVAEGVWERKDIGVEVGVVVDAVAVDVAVAVVVAEVNVGCIEILRGGVVGDSVAVAGAEVNVESIEILKVGNVGDSVAVVVGGSSGVNVDKGSLVIDDGEVVVVVFQVEVRRWPEGVSVG